MAYTKVTKACKGCGEYFSGHPNAKFHSKECKDRWHNATNPRGFQAGLFKPYVPKTKAEIENEAAMDAAEGSGWDAHKFWTE